VVFRSCGGALSRGITLVAVGICCITVFYIIWLPYFFPDPVGLALTTFLSNGRRDKVAIGHGLAFFACPLKDRLRVAKADSWNLSGQAVVLSLLWYGHPSKRGPLSWNENNVEVTILSQKKWLFFMPAAV
jgi:hypothetical protein